MTEEIKEDNNCIIKAFENHPIAIISEQIGDKKIYCFKASDIGKALKLSNIAVSIQHYDEDERVIRKAYDTTKRNQDTVFLTSQGVYRVLYNSKKPEAKKFRKWVGSILDDIIFNDSMELKRQLEEQNKLLINKSIELEKTKNQLEKKTKLAVKKWYEQEPGDIIYGSKSNKDDPNSLITIGKSKNIKKRERGYFTCNQNADIFYIKRCYNCDLAEKVIHHILDKYREEKNKEWFVISEKLSIYVIDMVCDFLDMFINCSEKIPEFKINEFLKDLPVEKIINKISVENFYNELDNKKEEKIKQRKEKCKSKYLCVTFDNHKNKWVSSITINHKKIFLGYYDEEIAAATAYNDYVCHLNSLENSTKKYILNKIDNYIENPINIPMETKTLLQVNKTSAYNNVTYNDKMNMFGAYINFNKETKHICYGTEIECAKKYNQQALYYNNTFGTNYILNNISDYEIIPKDIIMENKTKYLKNKSSKYIGVNLLKNGKYRSYLKYNDVQYYLGLFELELDAAKTYNNYALYLNQIHNENYILNDILDYITVPINVIEENKKLKKENKVCKFTGVSYNSVKNLYSSCIKFSNKLYRLGYSKNEIDCAKLYNQQALYFNQVFNTSYELNEIPNYITIAKNVNKEYENNRHIKTSKYVGVNKLPDGRYRALLVFNKKQLKLGNFIEEIDAAKAYNNKARELNEKYDKRYHINML